VTHDCLVYVAVINVANKISGLTQLKLRIRLMTRNHVSFFLDNK